MKKLGLLKLLVVCGITFAAAVAFANDGDDAKNHPCKKIKEACEAAGFVKGGHKDKKGLHVDCMKPIMDGGTVAGVNVSAEDLAACKAKREAHMGKKAAKKN